MIPDAFRPYKKFMVYKLVPKANGKTDKVPVNPLDPHNRNKEKYEAFNDVNLFSADEATAYAEMLGADHGVGFYFTADDPFFFVDIDGAYESGQWSPVATDLCNRFKGCYVEVSQSGTGLHIFGTGTPPADHANKNVKQHLELYTRERFVALTGTHAIGDAATYVNGELTSAVNEYFTRQTVEGGGIVSGWTDRAVDGYSGPENDDELIAKMRASKPNAKKAFNNEAQFADLFDGNMQLIANSYPPETDSEDLYNGSSADIALANYFSFWTGGDCERIERLMKRSALVRTKWDSARGKTTWLRETILKSVQSTSKFYSVLDADQALFSDRIAREGVNLDAIERLSEELKNMSVSKAEREILVGEIHKTAKNVGLDLTKTTIKELSKPDFIGFVPFIDITSTGKPLHTIENVEALFAHYGITPRYNVIKKEPEVMIPDFRSSISNQLNNTLAECMSRAERHNLSKSAVADYIGVIADKNLYNPVAEWITSKDWDGVDRLGALMFTLGRVPTPLTTKLMRTYLINGIKAVFDPNGVESQGVLVLQGPQGAGKTRWLEILFGGTQWFKTGCILDPSDKDSLWTSIRSWGTELGELDATFKKSDIARLKAFLTDKTDEFRLPYARGISKFPRQTVFCASVNPGDFLADDSGNRRFWVIPVDENLNSNHNIDIQQVWAQAYVMYLKGEVHWLDAETQAALNDHNSQFDKRSKWHDLIGDMYDGTADRSVWRQLTASEVANEIGLSVGNGDAQRVAKALRDLYGSDSIRVGKERRRVYEVPPRMAPIGAFS